MRAKLAPQLVLMLAHDSGKRFEFRTRVLIFRICHAAALRSEFLMNPLEARVRSLSPVFQSIRMDILGNSVSQLSGLRVASLCGRAEYKGSREADSAAPSSDDIRHIAREVRRSNIFSRCQQILCATRNESDVRFNASACNSVQPPDPLFESTEFPRRMGVYHFRITAAFLDVHSYQIKSFIMSGELGGDRTHDPRLKRALLYQLSYELTSISTYLDSIN